MRTFFAKAVLGLGVAAIVAGCTPQSEKPIVHMPLDKQLTDNLVLTKAGRTRDLKNVFPTKINAKTHSSSRFVKDATCKMSAETFDVSFTATTTLTLPGYGPTTPPMTVTCTYNDKEISRSVTAINLTAQAYQTQAVGHMLVGLGLIGALVTAGQADSRDKTKDIWGYPTVTMTF